MSGRALRVRFDLPRGELERAERDAAVTGTRRQGGRAFEENHLWGRLHLDIGVQLAHDPVLAFLRDRRDLRTAPPLTVSFDEPLALVLGALAGRAVLALHREGSFMIPLSGDRGALGVHLEDENLEVSLPLDRYAGVAPVPAREGALAIEAAASQMARLVGQEAPSLKDWAVLRCIERDARILRALAQRGPSNGSQASWPRALVSFPLPNLLGGGHAGLVHTLEEAERSGAHVVPYWRVEQGDDAGGLTFAPLARASLAHTRGSLARLLFPEGERILEAVWPSSPENTARLRQRLERPRPFRATADPATGQLRFHEDTAPSFVT